MSPLTLSSTLGALRKAGSVFGVIFCRQDEVIFSDAPFIPERITEMATTLDDIAFYFQKENRHADQLAFGYDGGNLVVVVDELFRIIVLHSTPDEVDFIAKAAHAFLKDYQMSLFTDSMREGANAEEAEQNMLRNDIPHHTPEEVIREESMRPVTQRVSLKAEQASDPTEPINPTPVIQKTEPVTPVQAQPAARQSGYAEEETALPTREYTEPIQPAPSTAAPAQVPAYAPAPTPDPAPAQAEAESGAEEQEHSGQDESQTVMLSREHTAPILAANQPANTLPPPRMPKKR